jgi:hypothetical protein
LVFVFGISFRIFGHIKSSSSFDTS